MNGTDNIAGYSLTVGTADMVITDSVDQYDPIIGNVTNGASVNYKIQFIDPSMSTDYETGTGTWNSGIATISRATVKTSSNGGSLVNFGAGPKVVFLVDDYDSIQSMGTKFETSTAKVMTNVERDTIANLGNSSGLDIGTTASTVAAGDDSRFGSVDYGDLDPATVPLAGTEIVGLDQGGDGVQATVQDVSGNAVIAMRTFAMDRVTDYTNFNRMGFAFANTTDDTMMQLEAYICRVSGTAATCYNGASILNQTCMALKTGTDTTGAACIQSTEYPIVFDPTKEYDQTWQVGHVALPTVGQASTTQVGFIVGAPALASQGMYFYLDQASNNWFYAVKNAGGTTSDTTGVAGLTFPNSQAFRVHYNPDAPASTKFYINGALVGTVLNSTRVVATGQLLGMALSIRKSAGILENYVYSLHHYYNIQRTVLAYF